MVKYAAGRRVARQCRGKAEAESPRPAAGDVGKSRGREFVETLKKKFAFSDAEF